MVTFLPAGLPLVDRRRLGPRQVGEVVSSPVGACAPINRLNDDGQVPLDTEISRYDIIAPEESALHMTRVVGRSRVALSA